jgi:putative CocE/NonD family hydrolase
MGDARLDYDALTYGWFDHFLKGEDNKILDNTPKVRYYTMGLNKWQTSNTWPPEGAQPMTLYLTSGGRANTLYGDGALTPGPAPTDKPDSFVFDPLNPVPSYGGNVCCTGNAVTGGAFDQRAMETRNDILVYTSEPLAEPIQVSGPVEATLYVSSDAKDTDVTIKLIDVLPDGTAYNLDETIQRLRYRNGYEKPPVWMERGKVYPVTLQPMTTSNYFPASHRIRIEISSSNFPRFDRNMNTGGRNYDETTGVVAHNSIHHSQQFASKIVLTVVKRSSSPNLAFAHVNSPRPPATSREISR